jgi:hypothetical protein
MLAGFGSVFKTDRPVREKRRTGNTGRDDNDVGAREGLFETIILGKVSGNDLYPASVFASLLQINCPD